MPFCNLLLYTQCRDVNQPLHPLWVLFPRQGRTLGSPSELSQGDGWGREQLSTARGSTLLHGIVLPLSAPPVPGRVLHIRLAKFSPRKWFPVRHLRLTMQKTLTVSPKPLEEHTPVPCAEAGRPGRPMEPNSYTYKASVYICVHSYVYKASFHSWKESPLERIHISHFSVRF